ncbi:hypothetical protein [Sphingopyxis sp. GC21]|uniref:hypothetical protein n=1 Tax=Sphingopyxis sp. GC21 TaxID=2933562 RepID=UPI0021E40ADF|nr:hypothetical protein [Sphingopyxis sp. GC21]
MSAFRFVDWDDVVAFACALPRCRNGALLWHSLPESERKAFVSPGREAGSFHVMCPIEEKELLLETDPVSSGKPRIMKAGPACSFASRPPIPAGSPTSSRRAWWDRAKKAQRAAFGPRP